MLEPAAGPSTRRPNPRYIKRNAAREYWDPYKERKTRARREARESARMAMIPPRASRAGLNIRTGGLVGLEYKYVDQFLANTTPTTSWVGGELDPVAGVNCIGACTQGSGESQRDGTRIAVKSIQIQGYCIRTPTVATGSARGANLIQISLVMDTQTNATQLNAEDVYLTQDPEVPARRVVANSQRFRVLKTWMIELHDQGGFNDAAATGSLAGMMVPFSCYKKMNVQVDFVAGAGAGTIADFKTVSFHMIACSAVAVATDFITYNSRVRFIG